MEPRHRPLSEGLETSAVGFQDTCSISTASSFAVRGKRSSRPMSQCSVRSDARSPVRSLFAPTSKARSPDLGFLFLVDIKFEPQRLHWIQPPSFPTFVAQVRRKPNIPGSYQFVEAVCASACCFQVSVARLVPLSIVIKRCKSNLDVVNPCRSFASLCG